MNELEIDQLCERILDSDEPEEEEDTFEEEEDISEDGMDSPTKPAKRQYSQEYQAVLPTAIQFVSKATKSELEEAEQAWLNKPELEPFSTTMENAEFAYHDSLRGYPTWLACVHYGIPESTFRGLRLKYRKIWDKSFPVRLEMLATLLIETASDQREMSDSEWDEYYRVPRDSFKVKSIYKSVVVDE